MSQLPAQPPETGTKPPGQSQLGTRDIAFDYLRSFVIVLVVFHHAALAYTSFSTFDETRYVDSTAPVVDASRWTFLDPFVTFNDTFFMSLLFLVSGLFTISSLEHKGSKSFFLARLKRLGIPFAVASLSIVPLAYWPSRLLADSGPQTPYWITFFGSDGWPSGPLWFLWVLLAFNGLVALADRIAPTLLAELRRQPTGLVVILVTIASYLPSSLLVSRYSWTSLGGPFDVQASRIVLYFAYFLLGTALGTSRQWRRGGWPRHWGAWLIVGVLSFFVYVWLLMNDTIPLPTLASEAILSVAFASSCAGTCLGFLGAFRRLVRGSHAIFDSLSANAYGIYIIHYVFITWIQLVLLSAPWPAWIKFSVTFAGGLTLSWGASQVVRQIPAVRRVL
ncbi:MAG: acyltransferase [Holophagales bacterium]|nr:acyltransferase [Holophagales bacterium]